MKNITMFFANASARCCAPAASNLLSWRFSVVNVCIKNWICVNGIDEERMNNTVFFVNASARCRAPSAAM